MTIDPGRLYAFVSVAGLAGGAGLSCGPKGADEPGHGATGAAAAYDAYRIAHEAVLGFDRDVIDRIHESLGLARESLLAGKISLLEFNVVRRDLVDTRLGDLDALADLVEARSALELAAGGSWL